MTIQVIDLGTIAQDGADGDLAREAFIKVNANFQDLEDRKVEKVAGKQLSTEDYTTIEKGKLAGIAVGATANQTDTYLLDRANHTGQQTISTITDLATTISQINTDISSKQNTLVAGTNITIDNTDPFAPIISSSGGGGGGGSVETVAGVSPDVSADIPATDLITALGINDKVDKVVGKGLSTEDYTTSEKSKLSGIESGAQVNVATNLSVTTKTATTFTVESSTGADAVLPSVTTTEAGLSSAADKTKLDGIQAGATVNQTDAYLLARANHTGSQAISTITGLQTGLDSKQATLVSGNNIKTVNGQSLLGSGDVTVSASLPITSKDDLIVGDVSGQASRLPVGQSGTFLGVSNGNLGYYPYPTAFSAEYLIVAGGGSGGATIQGFAGGGGGGGGGVLTGTVSLGPTGTYAVVVGSGGSGVNYNSGAGNNGGSSSFSGFTAIGGGGGAGISAGAGITAKTGGAGGGGSFSNRTGAAGTSGQGFAGGNSVGDGVGGGGGAGAVGANASGSVSGTGGAGKSSSVTGVATLYGGGGGGGGFSTTISPGAAGAGGGGAGASSTGGGTNGVSGQANTGGGGGGSPDTGSVNSLVSGAGGSGVVIVRYSGVPRGTGGTITQSGGFTIHTFNSSGNLVIGL